MGKDEWISVIFSDEKKFNLDGPDGWASYWHDLRCQPRTFFSCQQGGGSVMVCAGFVFNGTTDVAFLSGRQKSVDYQQTLKDFLLPVSKTIAGDNWLFQQDGASIHTSNQLVHGLQPTTYVS